MQHVMPVGQKTISVTLTLSSHFTVHTFILLSDMEKFYGVTLPSVARISHCKRNSSELWLVHNPEIHVEVCGDRFSLFHGNIYFH